MHLLFLITFPAFFCYHYLVSVWGLPAFLAGYSTPICFATLPVLLAAHLCDQLNDDSPPFLVDRLFWLFLGYYGLVTFWQLSTRNMLSSADAHPTVIAQFIALYLLGRHIQPQQRGMMVTIMLALSAMVFHIALSGGLVGAALEGIGEVSGLITYQGYAFAYFVTLAWTIALLNDHPGQRIVIYLLAFVALFLNGARSEFAAAVIAFVGLEFLLARRKDRALLAVFAAVLVAVAAYFIFEEEIQDYRVITIFTDYSEDLSVLDRKKMLADGLQTIDINPVTGRFGSYLGGEYIHSYLSAWVDLGVVGFMLFVCLSLMPVLHLLRHRRDLREDPQLQLLLVLTASSLLLSITAKPFTQYLLPLTLGICSSHAHRPWRKAAPVRPHEALT